jgi:Phosphotransferase enzyme family
VSAAAAQTAARAAAAGEHLRDVLSTLLARGYLPEGEPFATGRSDRTTLPFLTPSGLRVVAKVFPAGGGETCWTNLLDVWSSSFGEKRQPPGLPRPVEYVRPLDAVVLERLLGRALAELGEPDGDAVEGAMRLAAALHGCDARPRRRRSADGILRSLRRKADRVSDLAPALAPPIRAVVEALEAVGAKDGELVPCHGDFSPRNVLVAPERRALIDWDRFQLADPARDVAYFGAWCWVERVRRGEPPSWLVLERAVSTYEALRPEARLGERLGFHVAAALVRIADDLVLLCPEESRLVPLLAEEALRRLEETG